MIANLDRDLDRELATCTVRPTDSRRTFMTVAWLTFTTGKSDLKRSGTATTVASLLRTNGTETVPYPSTGEGRRP
jgi:hypothetical protein